MEKWENALIFSIGFENMNMSNRSVWAFESNVGFTNRLLFGSFTKKMFKQRMHVSHNTFIISHKFLCERLYLYLHEKNTYMKETS